MAREIPLRRLALADRSALVATNLRVIHDRHSGMFGQQKTSIRREAITSVQVGWRRSKGLLLAGVILLGIWWLMWMGAALTREPPETAAAVDGVSIDEAFRAAGRFFSSSLGSVVKYGALLAGVATSLTFWFYRRREVQITAAGATIKGYPRSYEEGLKFCDFLLGLQQVAPLALAKEEPEVKAEKGEKPAREEKSADEEKAQEKEWRFS